MEVAAPNEATAFLYSRHFAYLPSKRTPIPINDRWIAAITQQHEATLLTYDQLLSLLAH